MLFESQFNSKLGVKTNVSISVSKIYYFIVFYENRWLELQFMLNVEEFGF